MMKQYEDYKGDTHLYFNELELVQIMSSEILELRATMVDYKKQVIKLTDDLDSIRTFVKETNKGKCGSKKCSDQDCDKGE